MQAHPTTHASAPSPYATAPLPRAPPPHAIAQVGIRKRPPEILLMDLSRLGIIGCVRCTLDYLTFAIDVVKLGSEKNGDSAGLTLRRLKKKKIFPKVADFTISYRSI